jgi:hypothetical protein
VKLSVRLPRIPRPRWPHRDQPVDTRLVPAAPEGVLRRFRAAALWAIGILIAAASGAAFTESYRGLYTWCLHHGLRGFWAAAAPIQVDTFIGVGELTLFIAMVDGWRWRDRLGAWAVALLGLAVSVGGNIGHLIVADAASRATAAVPPVAAFAALWLGLAVLKRIVAHKAGQAMPDTAGTLLPEIPTDAEVAALLALRATTWGGQPPVGAAA